VFGAVFTGSRKANDDAVAPARRVATDVGAILPAVTIKVAKRGEIQGCGIPVHQIGRPGNIRRNDWHPLTLRRGTRRTADHYAQKARQFHYSRQAIGSSTH
jgi:hypothetical protein